MNPKKRPSKVKASVAVVGGGIALFIAAYLRLVALLSSAGDLSGSLGTDATLWLFIVALLFAFVVVLLVLLLSTAKVKRGLGPLRREFPAALVQPVTVRADQLDTVRAWGVSPHARIPAGSGLVAQLVVTEKMAALYCGRRPRLVIRCAGEGIFFEIGSTTTIYGDFEHLAMAHHDRPLPPIAMFPVDERGILFPRRMRGQELRDLCATATETLSGASAQKPDSPTPARELK
ncbi:MAG: hypothetical protein J0I43_09765 [Microbacterium sp.]|uniref:hypothetical protein n=1 Tax=Microbacterium sp. TaxID=51671 RepID=UPI001ACD734C|nr:hypothetical protein [Microbacterium sp.]MBN9177638.1 hypothetical protein [Microbacterium sp.]